MQVGADVKRSTRASFASQFRSGGNSGQHTLDTFWMAHCADAQTAQATEIRPQLASRRDSAFVARENGGCGGLSLIFFLPLRVRLDVSPFPNVPFQTTAKNHGTRNG